MTRGTGTTPRFPSHARRPCMHSQDVEERWWKAAAAAAVASCVGCDPARDHACDSMDSRIRGVARSRRTQQTKQRRAHERMLLDRELALSLRGERCVMHDAVASICMLESECTAQQAGSCARIRGMRLRGSSMCPIRSWTGARITREWSRGSGSSKRKWRALREERRVAVSCVVSLSSFTLHVCVELPAVLPFSQSRACASRAYLNFCAGKPPPIERKVRSVLKLGISRTPETMETFGAARPRLFSRSHDGSREKLSIVSEALPIWSFRCCFLI